MKRLLPPLIGASLLGASLFGTQAASADEPEAMHRYSDERLPPPGARTRLAISGAAITAGFYLPALGASYLWSDTRGASELRIPVVGPWMKLGTVRLCQRQPTYDPDCSDFGVVLGAVLLTLDGIGQAGGVAVMLQSIFMSTAKPGASAGLGSDVAYYRPPMTQTESKHPLTFQSGSFKMTPAPFVGDSSEIGLSLLGSF